MKLLYSLLFALFQVSNGLKIDSGIRSVHGRFSQAVQQTSSQIASVSRQLISVAVLGTLISIAPGSNISPSFAANLEASQLFAKAESAIEGNLRDFKGLESDWSNAKKVLSENANLVSKVTGSLSAVTTKMTEYDGTLAKMMDDDVAATTGINAEIAALKESTGSKYAAAEAASAIPAKPAVTAQLFLKAQNEASILAQDEKVLKDFSETIGIDSSLKKRVDDVLAGLTGTVAKATEIQAIQAAGLLDMTEGLASNSKACKDSLNECSESGEAGLLQFRNGVKTVGGADEKFSKLKKDVSSYLRLLETVEVDITKTTVKLNEIALDSSAWEESSKLRLKNGKSTVKTTIQKFENTLKQTTSMIEKLTATNELLSDKKSDNRKEVSDILRLASAQLDTADKSGKLAEKLLKQAKAQGDKESAKYLKFVPLTASATPPATAATTTK